MFVAVRHSRIEWNNWCGCATFHVEAVEMVPHARGCLITLFFTLLDSTSGSAFDKNNTLVFLEEVNIWKLQWRTFESGWGGRGLLYWPQWIRAVSFSPTWFISLQTQYLVGAHRTKLLQGPQNVMEPHDLRQTLFQFSFSVFGESPWK